MKQKRLLLLLALLLTAATGAWAQTWTSGDCTVTLSNGTLTISGTGAMADYTKVTEQPWASNRNSITSIVVGEGVTHIGNFALMGCTKATSVSLPSSLTSIGASAFRVCNNAGFTSIAIPANVETIGDNAFHTCNKLTQVNIPDKVTSIGQNAFYGCTAVTSITVGKSVTSIGEVAFRNCSAMTTLAVKAPACALGTNALDACSSLTTIYVTTDKADYYKSADGWSAYAAKIQAGYDISLKEGTEDAYKWAIMPGLAAEGQTVTLQYNGRLKVKGVTAKLAEPVTLATPLTIEAITPGTIVVDMSGTLSTGMKYSVNGGTKTLITKSEDIPVAKGDKVQFYGNGTDTKVYGGAPGVIIKGSGDGFQTKVYGNIMSLLDETGFATKTELPNESYVFFGLFRDNTTLIDASELLLPAATLSLGCYREMFYGCTSLTTAPKLPATTLASACYYGMFYGCESLTSAYVKAAYIEGYKFECGDMFTGCTATDAVLHTTSGSKDSWEGKMGTDKTWENWTVADDWKD